MGGTEGLVGQRRHRESVVNFRHEQYYWHTATYTRLNWLLRLTLVPLLQNHKEALTIGVLIPSTTRRHAPAVLSGRVTPSTFGDLIGRQAAQAMCGVGVEVSFLLEIWVCWR
jgi:hypothetical protein